MSDDVHTLQQKVLELEAENDRLRLALSEHENAIEQHTTVLQETAISLNSAEARIATLTAER